MIRVGNQWATRLTSSSPLAEFGSPLVGMSFHWRRIFIRTEIKKKKWETNMKWMRQCWLPRKAKSRNGPTRFRETKHEQQLAGAAGAANERNLWFFFFFFLFQSRLISLDFPCDYVATLVVAFFLSFIYSRDSYQNGHRFFFRNEAPTKMARASFEVKKV